ncbi:MAG: cytochrome-c peroxidase [Saprospiraceae bacterium]|nr:cytochrome-c peroxidase [Saprospiraceae bacterium]HMW39741.1 cytochrome c peroxidase [Saprospiraceae bacterium]HMX89050.1 cytochrome c peroxidase [Saprospiraceae bacterium]HMZ40677.1 cytochrome c peroxidase [Saprospiraceae bacterium]HNA63938.1 cytochrome c peroxidase [Saprospiraceae bacterium]
MKYKLIFLFLTFSIACSVIRSGNEMDEFPEKVKSIRCFDPEAAFQLGRLLFYDPGISSDSSISCSSCHSSYNAFAHGDHRLSHGIRGNIVTRNAPGLFNLSLQPMLMWDGAANNLEDQMLIPIHQPKEMDSNFRKILAHLSGHSSYTDLFNKAFGSQPDSVNTLHALAAFQLRLISQHSRYDSVRAGRKRWTSQEKNGLAIFKEHCQRCHVPPAFSDYSFRDNGLPMDPQLRDSGRFVVTRESNDLFCFKVPSLRNLSYTAPYMHDGRFDNLRQVLLHYASGKIMHGDSLLRKGIALNSKERTDLIAFLLSLNDPSFVHDTNTMYPSRWVQDHHE